MDFMFHEESKHRQHITTGKFDGYSSEAEFVFTGLTKSGNALKIVVPRGHRYTQFGLGWYSATASVFTENSHESISVALLGHGQSILTAAQAVIDICSELWNIPDQAVPVATLGVVGMEGAKPEQPVPLHLPIEIKRHIMQKPEPLIETSDWSLCLLRSSNLHAKNRGLVIWLGLMNNNDIHGFIQIYLLRKDGDLPQLRKAGMLAALRLWNDLLN